MLNFKKGFLLFLSLLFLFLAYNKSYFFNTIPLNQVKKFQEVFSAKEAKALKGVEQLEHWDKSGQLNQHHSFFQSSSKDGLSFFIYKNNKIAFWSEDASILDSQLLESTNQLLLSKNSAQYKVSKTEDTLHYVCLILLKREYAINNKYLKSNFQEDFMFPNIVGVSKAKNQNHSIYKKDKKPAFSLIVGEAGVNSKTDLLDFVFLLLAVSCFLFLIHLLQLNLLIKTGLAFAVRIGLLYFLPYQLVKSTIFGADLLAINDFIPSLGDFFFHSIFLFFICYQINSFLVQKKSKWLSVITLIIAILLSLSFIWLIKWSVFYSQISLDFQQLFHLDRYSLIALVSLSLILFSTLLLFKISISNLKNQSSSKLLGRFLLLLSLALMLTFLLFGDTFILLWFIVPITVFYLSINHSNFKQLASLFFILIYSSLTIAYLINNSISSKEKQQRPLIIKKLAEEKDPIAEYLFEEAQLKLRVDSFLLKQSQNYWSNKSTIDQYLLDNYFSGYWQKYQINFSICNPLDSVFVNAWNTSTSCISYFQNRISREGDMISSNNLFQLRNLAGRIDYLAEIRLKNDSNSYRLFIEFSSNLFNENEGYPELLLDNKSKSSNWDLNEYDYGVYNKNELIFRNGDYNYPTKLRLNELSIKSFYQYTTESFQHLAYQKDKNITIILSKGRVDFYNHLTSTAYLLVFISLVFLLLSSFLSHFIFSFQFNFNDFSFKIQFFLISSLLIAMILLSATTTYYIQKQYQLKNGKHLKEKIRSINFELENKIGGEEFLAPEFQPILFNYLVKFSNVFYSDINFYDQSGILFSSSRPEIFEKGLKSTRMQSDAYRALIEENKAQWLQNERIGNLQYISAYIPFKNYNNETLGYLNLPYFARQNELEEEISDFIVSNLNIYVAIFILALLISVLLINQLSKPLLLIRQQIGRLKFGSSIELIEWKSKDEIGALVEEYNRIAIELGESAEQLAKSERESAWREMAKQVAHEIKNPLTPMKLSIQHLQRAANMQSEDLEERINKTSQTLIEQIDTLTNIASAFSSFARLPEKKFEETDLLEIIETATNLYSNTQQIIVLKNVGDGPFLLKSDKDQLLRLFNNLIKNSIQATEENKEPIITIDLKKENGFYEISIKDNGIGIEKDQLERIFEPNFTTKSSGTGLGLAMSKSIVEQMGGELQVDSKIGQGATFIVTLPFG